MKYDIGILVNNVIPRLEQAKATLNDCRGIISSINIPSDFSESGKIKGAASKISNILSILDRAKTSVRSSIDNFIAASNKNTEVIKNIIDLSLNITQNVISKTTGKEIATANSENLKKYGGSGFHKVKDGDGYTQVYVTKDGGEYPDFKQYTGSNGDGTYEPNSIAEYPFAADNIHGHGCPVCSIESLAYGNGLEQEIKKSKAIKTTADDMNKMLNGREIVNREEAVKEMEKKGLNPVLIEDLVENEDIVREYLEQGKSMVVRVPEGTEFCSSGHMMVVPEMVGENQVVILNPGKRDNNKGCSGIYDIDKILYEDGYVIVADL